MSETQETQLREELIRRLAAHDWYYQRSDDYGAIVAGEQSLARINQLIRLVPDGADLYRQRAPKMGY